MCVRVIVSNIHNYGMPSTSDFLTGKIILRASFRHRGANDHAEIAIGLNPFFFREIGAGNKAVQVQRVLTTRLFEEVGEVVEIDGLFRHGKQEFMVGKQTNAIADVEIG